MKMRSACLVLAWIAALAPTRALADDAPAAPDPAAPAAPASPAPDGCSGWPEVYARVRPSVVRIDVANTEQGTGILFPDPCHVATALHVVDTGHGVRVKLASGAITEAHVVAIDAAHDLAILALASCAKGGAALRAGAKPVVGAPVMAVGDPLGWTLDVVPSFKGLESSATTGIVSATNDAYVQSDAVVNPGSSGGPLVDCHGDVVGIVHGSLAPGMSLANAATWLVPLAQSAVTAPRAYAGKARPTLSLGLQFDASSSDGYQGFSLGLGVVVHERWFGALRLAYLPWGGPGGASGPVTNPVYASGSRAVAELLFGPRFMVLPFNPNVLYVQVAAGGSFTYDVGSQSQLSIAPGGGSILATPSRYETSRWEPLGMVGFFLGAKGALELSYTLRVDVDRFASSTSQFAVGFWF